MRIARSTGALSGLLVALLGIWGALIPFVGPYFDYSFGTNTTWHYTTDRLWLSILPGAAALLAGILLLLAGTRLAGVIGGWLGVAAGAWFVVGPSVSLTWEHGAGPIGRPLFDSTRQTLELVGYFYGLGALIVALSAFAIGRFASRPRLLEESPVAAGKATAAVPAAQRIRERPRPASERQPVARQKPLVGRPAAGAPSERTAQTEPLGGQPDPADPGQPDPVVARPRARGEEPARRRRRSFPFSVRRARARSGYDSERGEPEREAPEPRT
ncbi:MAG TPA: hypothetical protein VMB05_09630 [Solirubrobacteraceae bacterium]|nr:hypothetical protein [Solirubrobacteraceae bacterium]